MLAASGSRPTKRGEGGPDPERSEGEEPAEWRVRPPAREHAAPPPLLVAPSTPTDFAGLFFFLNLEFFDEEGELDRWELLAYLGRALDAQLEDDPLWDVLAELAGTRPERSRRGPLERDPDSLELPDPLPLIRERLPVDDPIPFLLRRFGRVALTPAHVDVFFSLAAHPIEIRLSGLDRDPGWLLPAGRHVAFHFD